MTTLPPTGFLRIRQVLALIPVAKSTWLKGVREGRYPRPIKALGHSITAWKVEDIRRFIEDSSSAEGPRPTPLAAAPAVIEDSVEAP